MKLFNSLFLSALISGASFATADYELIKDLVGSYPLIELNGNFNLGGTAEIVAADSGVGFRITPLAKSSKPAPQINLISGKEPTQLTREASTVSQTYKTFDESLKIDYVIADGFLEISTEDCKVSDCSRLKMVLSRGKAKGKLMDAREFFTARRGNYLIEKAGGTVPDPADNVALVEPGSNSDEEMLTIPFCQPEGCDPGWFYFPYGTTYIYEHVNTPERKLFTILHQRTKLRRFTWEETGNSVVFTNYQYNLIAGGTIALEHLMKKP